MNKVNNFGTKILKFVRGDSFKSPLNKFKGSIFAIGLGIILAIFPMFIDVFSQDASITKALKGLFVLPFTKNNYKQTLVFMSIFMLVGGGIGISFKTGLFNIGAAGQMMMAGAIAVIVGILKPNPEIPRTLWIFILMVISMVVGALVAAISGALKAIANVHEVVSTIMLNWIVFYFLKWIFAFTNLRSTTSTSSRDMSSHYAFRIDLAHKWDFIAIIAIAIIVLLIIGFIFKYTKFGFSMRVNGLNTQAAKYSGINNKLTTIYSMAFSGSLAGLGGYILYGTIYGQMPEFSTLPTIGFEAITVTLLSFSSPIGAIFAGAFYGMFYNGSQIAYGYASMTKETFQLIIGIIVFVASIAPILSHIKPYIWTRDAFLVIFNQGLRQKYLDYRKRIKVYRNEYNAAITKYKKAQNEAKQVFLEQSHNPNLYDNNNFQLANSLSYHHFLNKYLNADYKLELAKLNLKTNLSISENHREQKLLLNQLKNKQNNLNVFEKLKIKLTFRNNIKSTKANYKLQKTEYINRMINNSFTNKQQSEVK